MRIIKKQVKDQPLTVTVEYPEWNGYVEGLINRLEKADIRFSGRIDERTVSVSLSDIYYIENVERRLFLYTRGEVYRFDGSMTDIEKLTAGTEMVRISRTCIMNTAYLREIRQIRNSHLEAVMDNGEKLIVSRKYLPDIKRIFKREGV